MRIVKYIYMLSILTAIFIVIYRHSDKKGFRRFWVSIKIAILIAATLAGLIPHNAEATDTNNPTQPDEVILVKDDGILPGAAGYTLNNNPRRHPPGPPRMCRQEFPIGTGLERPKIEPIGTCPAAPSSRLFHTPKAQGS